MSDIIQINVKDAIVRTLIERLTFLKAYPSLVVFLTKTIPLDIQNTDTSNIKTYSDLDDFIIKYSKQLEQIHSDIKKINYR